MFADDELKTYSFSIEEFRPWALGMRNEEDKTVRNEKCDNSGAKICRNSLKWLQIEYKCSSIRIDLKHFRSIFSGQCKKE